MRAKEFIGEAKLELGFSGKPNYSDEELQNTADRIRRDCAPYLRSNGKLLQAGKNLYRGVQGADRMKNVFIRGTVRQNRRPRDTPMRWHSLMDQYFQAKFNFPYRSASMFAFSSDVSATNYGTPYAVFPIGDFKICVSESVEDFTTDIATDSVSPTIKEVLLRMSEDEVKQVAATYGFMWATHSDVIKAFYRYNIYDDDEEAFQSFLTNYLFPRLNYFETNSIGDIGESEAMVRCSSYYGISVQPTYRYHMELVNKITEMLF